MEIWKPVPDWEGLYEVSNMGNVRSLPRQGKYREYGGCMRKPQPRNGYPTVSLSKNNQQVFEYVHRLVLRAFVGEPSGKRRCTNHENGNRADNRLENLEWVTYSENSKHACNILGTCIPPRGNPPPIPPDDQAGEANSQSKLTMKDVLYIREQCQHNYHWGLLTKLAKQFNVSVPTISMIVNRKRWNHI